MILILNCGISQQDAKMFEEEGKDAEKLACLYTIKVGNQTCGVIGLKSLLWANKRAELIVYLSKELEFDVLKYIIPVAIDKYLKFLSNIGLESIVYNADPEDKFMLYLVSNSLLNYICTLPYYFEDENGTHSSFLFEYYPKMQKKFSIKCESKMSSKEGSMKLKDLSDIIREKLKITIEDDNGIIQENLSQKIDEMPKKLPLDDVLFSDSNYRAVSPQYLTGNEKNINDFVWGYIEALQNRENLSIPLGEDKYFIQEGNGKYGASKQFLNFDYIVLDKNNNFVGYCNRLGTDGRNARIDIAISPKYQNMGIGTKLLSCYYDELFRAGYLSVTSYVFDFNEASKKLHDKLATHVGTRKNSYYSYGRLWDMNIYVKTKFLQ